MERRRAGKESLGWYRFGDLLEGGDLGMDASKTMACLSSTDSRVVADVRGGGNGRELVVELKPWEKGGDGGKERW